LPHFYPLKTIYNFKSKNIAEIQCQISGDMVNIYYLFDDIVPKSDKTTDTQNQISNKQQEDLQKEIVLRQEQLTSLKLALVIETDIARKFQLEQQIRVAEATLKELDDRLK
jgi:hypothetical protein